MRWKAASSVCFERATSSAAMGSPPPERIGHERAQVACRPASVELERAERPALANSRIHRAGRRGDRRGQRPGRASRRVAASVLRPRRRSRGATLPRKATSPAVMRASSCARSRSTGKAAAITPFSRSARCASPCTTGAEATSDSTRPARQLEDEGGGSVSCGERLAHPGDAGEVAAGLVARGRSLRAIRRPLRVEEEHGARAEALGEVGAGVAERLGRRALLREQRLGAGLFGQRAHLARAWPPACESR